MSSQPITHTFVPEIPRTLEPATLYVSIEYRTASHLCPRCGRKVVTPFRPGSWNLIFDGECVSIVPSIKNDAHGCGAHYGIDRDRVVPAWDRWGDESPGRHSVAAHQPIRGPRRRRGLGELLRDLARGGPP